MRKTTGRRSLLVVAMVVITTVALSATPAFAGGYPRGKPGTTMVLQTYDTSSCVSGYISGSIKANNDPPSLHDNDLFLDTKVDQVPWDHTANPGPETLPGLHEVPFSHIAVTDSMTLNVRFADEGKSDTAFSAEAWVDWECDPVPDVDEKIAIDYDCKFITWTLTQGDETVTIQERDKDHNPIGDPIVLTPENPSVTRPVSAGSHWYTTTLNDREMDWDPQIEECPKPPTDFDHDVSIKGVCVTDTSVKVLYAYSNGEGSVTFDLIKDGQIISAGLVLNGGEGTQEVFTEVFSVEPGVSYPLRISGSWADGDADDASVTLSTTDCIEPVVEPPEDPPPPPKGKCDLWIEKSVVRQYAEINGAFRLPLVEQPAQIDGVLVYRIDFGNKGDANCTGSGTRIMDLLPDNVAFLYAKLSDNVEAGYSHVLVFELYDSETHSVNADANTLVPGETGWILVTVKVLEPEVCGDFTLTNAGMITSRQYNTVAGWHNGWEGLNWVISNAVSVDVDYDCVEDGTTPSPDDESDRCICIIWTTNPPTSHLHHGHHVHDRHIRAALRDMQEQLDEVQDSLKDVQDELNETQESLEDVQDELNETQESLEDVQDALDETQDSLDDVQKRLNLATLLLILVLLAVIVVGGGAFVGHSARGNEDRKDE